MSEFGKLLRSSRLAQVARPLKKSDRRTHPTLQVLETRDAALARQEWGIKYALPSKVKSRYITLTELDSLERLVDFETNGGDHYRRLRFQETGLVPKVEGSGEGNPLFQKNKVVRDSRRAQLDDIVNLTPDVPKKRVQSILNQLRAMRPELRKELLARVPEELRDAYKKTSGTSISDEFENIAFDFLLKRVEKENVNHIDSTKRHGHKIAGTAGLSYALNGRLRNSPNGFVKREIVPGRTLDDGSSMNRNVALAGFVASEVSRTPHSIGLNKHPRETAIPHAPFDATIHRNGSVRIKTDLAKRDLSREPMRQTFSSSKSKRPVHRPLTFSPLTTSQGVTGDDVSSLLGNFIKNKQGRK
ncbi:Uncharacterized protein in HIS3 3'region [Cyberlindnera fabianii]|uniref:Uncharacterized protein in HIS3 3'region n=1 Tax=Cyberlindnera fabianii TaxID=36022 RepID=A0A1V2LEM6_CYBFA|nr:Uncharacterized protein in HIS3 3'region [Cyberlindnera fabianii]